jgi:hypothetical protein
MKRTSCGAHTAPGLSLAGGTLSQTPAADFRPPPPGAIAAEAAVRPVSLLTAHESAELRECESILDRGLATFFAVGNALLRIRNKRLYRATHRTFEEYCRERWNIGKSYAWRVIGAAERVNLLPANSSVPKPANEFQVRPFLKLSAEAFPGAWERALKLAQTGKVTPRVARAVIQDILPKEKQPSTRPSQRRAAGKLPMGQILVVLHEARQCIEKHQDDRAKEALERIEKLLCGPR